MKKTLICMLLLAALLVGCGKQQAAPTGTTEPTVATEPALPTDPPGTISEMGDPDVIDCGYGEGLVTEESKRTNVPCRIYAKKHLNNDAGFLQATLSIEVDTGAQLLQIMLDDQVLPLPELNCALYFGDVDGDGIDEIFVHNNTGGVGGFGIYCTWVLKVTESEIRILCQNYDSIGTGFESQFLDGYQLEVTNSKTGYRDVFDVKEQYGTYYGGSSMPGISMMLDPFYVFEPTDVDGDGVSEILCKQYASIFGHADHAGVACCILKFDPETQNFEVADAWFEYGD